MNNTNRRLLASYKGADGIKTGYTNAAGFNLVASAERGNVRVIATVFGGRSSASRNAKVAELLDLGFRRAPKRVATRKPRRPAYVGNVGSGSTATAQAPVAGKTIRLVTAVSKSLRPILRPSRTVANTPSDAVAAALQDTINDAVREAQGAEFDEVSKKATSPARPDALDTPSETIVLAAVKPEVHVIQDKPVVVTRIANSSDRFWGVNVGTYNSRYAAERALLKTALREMATLDGTVRKAQNSSKGFRANFLGMSKDAAELACRRLSARKTPCEVISPS